MSAPSTQASLAATLRAHPVWRWLPLTAIVHALLPVALAALWWATGPDRVGQALLGLHAVAGAALLGTLPWWWRHTGDVVMLILVDHMVTFAVVAALGWAVG